MPSGNSYEGLKKSKVRNEDKTDKDPESASGLMRDSRELVTELKQMCHGVRATHIERPEKEVKRLIMPELFISLLFLPWGKKVPGRRTPATEKNTPYRTESSTACMNRMSVSVVVSLQMYTAESYFIRKL